jgi:hypothetical protein
MWTSSLATSWMAPSIADDRGNLPIIRPQQDSIAPSRLGRYLTRPPQKQADRYGCKGHASKVNDEARLIETHAIIPVSDRRGTCRATNGICCPRQSVQNGEMFPAEVMRKQIRRDIGFAAQAYA